MCTRHYHQRSLPIIVTMTLALSASSTAMGQNGSVALPPCGGDPNTNTQRLQKAIDQAAPGSTLVLPPGVCVLAKCDIAQGAPCAGVAGRHASALYIGNRSNLILVGASAGTSVLKLDPNPPRRSDGYHAYCGDTHLLSIQGSSFITLRNFTVDGSDGELPEDSHQCPPRPETTEEQRIAEHMHDVYVRNSTDVTIDWMKITKAHGDGVNLIANPGETSIPRTERIAVTNTQFLANDRSGIGFQRNVGHVTVSGNYFRNSGDDQDLDMEPSGGQDNLQEVKIDNNRFERLKPGLTVTLGSGNTERSNGIRFTNNLIHPATSTGQGGCIFIYGADNTTIANNTVMGAPRCVTLSAQKVSGLRVENNRLEGYTNLHDEKGRFVPKPVISISERIVNQGDPATCGGAGQPPCPYFIHYPDQITIKGNTIIQHVQYSRGIELSNADHFALTNNTILHADDVAPVSPLDPASDVFRSRGIDLPFGVADPRSNRFYLNEKRVFQEWAITGNALSQFANGLRVAPTKKKVAVRLSTATLNSNIFHTAQSSPRGIWLVGIPPAPESGFVDSLTVNGNQFGCGFPGTPGAPPPPNAYVRPADQAHKGSIGSTVICR